MPADIFKIFPVNEVYCDFNQPEVIPSLYVEGITSGTSGNTLTGRFTMKDKENLNEEMLKFAEISGSFDFLSNSKEDIYSFDDGEDIC